MTKNAYKMCCLCLVIFVTSFTLSSSAQVEITRKDTTSASYSYVIGKTVNEKKQGPWIYYKDDCVTRISYFSNDTLTKSTVLFYENGTIKRVIPFKNGRISGNVNFYSREGELVAIYRYEDDEYYSTVMRRSSHEPAPWGHAYNPLLVP